MTAAPSSSPVSKGETCVDGFDTVVCDSPSGPLYDGQLETPTPSLEAFGSERRSQCWWPGSVSTATYCAPHVARHFDLSQCVGSGESFGPCPGATELVGATARHDKRHRTWSQCRALPVKRYKVAHIQGVELGCGCHLPPVLP